MRILLHDPSAGGHHAAMLRGVLDALRAEHDVIVAARPELLEECGNVVADVVPLSADAASGASADLDAFDAATAAVRPDHRLHLYAIRPVLARWLRRRAHEVPTSVLVISPAALHYPRAYATPLSPHEWGNALVKEALVRAFCRRRDAHAVLTMDPLAAERWARSARAPAFALPEPPVPPVPAVSTHSGVVVYGALSERKGIGHVTAALSSGADGLRVVVAGRADPDYAPLLDRELAALRGAGVRVEEHRGWIEDADALALLASAACAAVLYVGHKGTSRVLVEAATAGTPVVAHDEGLLGALVRRHGLGLTVNARDPAAVRAALIELTADPAASRARYAARLGEFAAASSPAQFRRAVCAPFATDASPRSVAGPVPTQPRCAPS